MSDLFEYAAETLYRDYGYDYTQDFDQCVICGALVVNRGKSKHRAFHLYGLTQEHLQLLKDNDD